MVVRMVPKRATHVIGGYIVGVSVRSAWQNFVEDVIARRLAVDVQSVRVDLIERKVWGQ